VLFNDEGNLQNVCFYTSGLRSLATHSILKKIQHFKVKAVGIILYSCNISYKSILHIL